MNPIDKMITSSVRCTRCGARGVGTCNCWAECACGWLHATGEACRNPKCSQHTKAIVSADGMADKRPNQN